jgi:hypothetical protein
MPPFIVDNDISMIMCNDSDNDENDMDRFIMSLEEELKSGIIVGASTPQLTPTVFIETGTLEEILAVDATPRRLPSRIRRGSSDRYCVSVSSGGQCSSPCSSLGGSSTTSTRSLRSRDPTIADFLKATGQNMEDISFSDLRKYTDRNLVRLAGKWEDLVTTQKTHEEDELLEVSAYLDDDHEDCDVNDDNDPLDLSLCEMSFCEEEEEDLLFKASLNLDCGRLEVEGIMLLSELEAEHEHMSSRTNSMSGY